MSRLQKTLADYAVIAISPALIIAMIASLVFFLVQVLYHGEYTLRLWWVLGCFVLATVLIARISIEEGRQYAAFFALPLAVVMWLALTRFVEFRGLLAPLGTLLNLGLLALIWWCADKLTWDCTVIDERQDASGEGLLQAAGLDRAESGGAALASVSPEPEAVSSHEVRPEKTWWERFLDRRRRPHAPGVWVIYVSLAALPLFGLGQRGIPAGDLAARRTAFWLLCIFAASSLGLLLTSSFLGLRRYLRQRRLEMPAAMAGVWLGTGAAMIVALLMLCTVFPRPHPEYSVTHWAPQIGSPASRTASRHSLGPEGAPDPDGRARHTTAPESADTRQARDSGPGPQADDHGSENTDKGPDDREAAGRKPGRGEGQGQQPSSEQSPRGTGQEALDQADKPAKPKPGEPPTGEGPARTESGPQPDRQPPQTPPQAEEQKPAELPGDSRAANKTGKPQGPKSTGRLATSPDAEPTNPPPDSDKSGEQPATTPSASPSFDPMQAVDQIAGSVPYLLKALYYLLVFGIVGYLAWRYRAELSAALQGFLQAVREFWEKLFGSHRKAMPEPEASSQPVSRPAPFADFSDPFSSGQAGRYAPEELVVYTFRAVEAWARDHACPRLENQTPHEFAAQIASRHEDVGQKTLGLADLYCAVAYSRQTVDPRRVGQLAGLWRALREESVAPAGVAG